MEIEIKIISTQIIKPSSPTPKSLQIHRLSLFDLMAPPFFVPFVFFYSSNPQIPNSEKTKTLKKSLSEILSRYYPLAGRLVRSQYVDCNDDGVSFSEAEAECDLSQVITNKNTQTNKKFLPYYIDEPHDFCMAAQATYFRCGGIAVGLIISHKVVDGASFFMFAKTWSEIARIHNNVSLPKLDSATYFPPIDISWQATGEAVSTRIFTFPAAKIAALQERYSDGGRHPTPSRSQALSAFIWTLFMSATGMRSDPNMLHIVRHAVNLRTRAHPKLSEYQFGNLLGSAVAKPDAGDGGITLVQKMREGLKVVDGGFVARLKNFSEKNLEDFIGKAQIDLGGICSFDFSSLCMYPVYETDFGWGRPAWVGPGGFPVKNLVHFMDTKSGDGIEALIHLSPQHMEKFEAYLKLQMLKSEL